MISILSSIFGVNFLSQLFKKAVAKYGDTGVHLIVLLAAIIVTCIWTIAKQIPSVMSFLETAFALFLSAVGLYETVWKRIGAVVNTGALDTSSIQ